jgi:hypothetical protein
MDEKNTSEAGAARSEPAAKVLPNAANSQVDLIGEHTALREKRMK